MVTGNSGWWSSVKNRLSRRQRRLAREATQRLSLSRFRRTTLEQLEERRVLTTLSVQILDGDAAEVPSGQTQNPGSFVIKRDVAETTALTVNYTLLGSARNGRDYQQLSGQTVIPANATQSAPIVVDVIDDDSDDDWENVQPVIDPTPGYLIGASTGAPTVVPSGNVPSDYTGQILIVDNDNYNSVTVSAGDPDAGEPGTLYGTGYFIFTRSIVNSSPLIVSYSVGGTATADADYPALSGSVIIPPNQAQATVTVNVLDDALPEPTETVIVSLIEDYPSYYNGSNSTAVVNIFDDDNYAASSSLVTVSGLGSAIEGETTSGYTITRSNGPTTNALNVSISMSGTAINGLDYQTIPPTVTIPPGQSSVFVSLNPIDNSIQQNTRTAILTLNNGAGYWTDPQQKNYPIEVADDDNNNWLDPIRAPRAISVIPGGRPVDYWVNPMTGDLTIDAAGGALRYINQRDLPYGLVHTFTSATVPNGIRVFYRTGGMGPYDVAYYSPTGYQANVPYYFGLPVNAGLYTDSRVPYDIRIETQNSLGVWQTERTQFGEIKHVDGPSWWGSIAYSWMPFGVDRLLTNSESGPIKGNMWIYGDGNMYWFAKDSSGNYIRQSGQSDFASLVKETDLTYTLTKKGGEVLKFNSTGMLTSRTDRVGNVTTYGYNGQSLLWIQDPSGRRREFGYTSSLLSSITEIDNPSGAPTATRVTLLGRDGTGRITSITEPDPDNAGPLTAPVTTFTYNSANQITSITDPVGQVTAFEYFDKGVKKVTHPDTATEQYGFFVADGAHNTVDGRGILADPRPLKRRDDVRTTYTNEINNIWYTKYDRYGTGTETTDPQGNLWTSTTDSNGYPLSVTGPDPDASGPETRPVTRYRYDSVGNLLSLTAADGSSQSWTYDSAFNQPLSYTDARGKQTLYTLDAQGNIVKAQQVINTQDPPASITDDLVTTFTYTTATTTPTNDAPGGLLSSFTDPLGLHTEYTYGVRNNITKIVHHNTTGLGVRITVSEYGYNDYDDVIWTKDGLARQTSYAYDNLHRATTVTLADPDGAGGQPAPQYLLEYDKNNFLRKVTDPLGRLREQVINSRGDVTQIKLPDHDNNGQLTTFTYAYDNHRRLTSATDSLGRVTTYGYDTLDRATTVTAPDPDGSSGPLTAPVTTYVYDPLGRRTQIRDANNSTTYFAYQNFWRQVNITLPDADGPGGATAGTIVQIYDANGNLTRSTDQLGRNTDLQYDDVSRLVSITAPDPDLTGPLTSSVYAFGYDKASNLTTVTDPKGNVTTNTYDWRNQLIQVTQPDPDGAAGPLPAPFTQRMYNSAFQTTSITSPDPDGSSGPLVAPVTTFAYDGLGRLKTITQADPDQGGPLEAPVIDIGYDGASRMTSMTAPDPDGSAGPLIRPVTTYAYDLLDNLTTITSADPDGTSGSQTSSVTTAVYDAAGQLLSATDALGGVTSLDYDNLGRVTKTTAPDPDAGGPLTRPYSTYLYDAVGNVLQTTDPLGRKTSYVYDRLNRLVSRQDPDPDTAGSGVSIPTTTYVYDAVGNLKSLTDPSNNTTSWDYDRMDRVTKETNPLGKLKLYEYDKNSNLTKMTDRLNRVTEYTIDNLDRTTKETWKNSSGTVVRTLNFSFDSLDRLTSTNDNTGGGNLTSLTYSYDTLSRPTQENQANAGLSAVTFNSKYDSHGNRTELKGSFGSQSDFKNSYSYDYLDRMTSMTQQSQGTGANFSVVAPKRVDFQYNKLSQYTQVDRYESTDTSALVAGTTYSYDGMHRLTTIDHKRNTTGLAKFDYAYDAGSRITSETDTFASNTSWNASHTYTYDNLDQVKNVTHTGGQANESYAFDVNGTRTSANGSSYTTTTNNRITNDGTYTYTYDDEGNMVSRATPAGPSSETTTYTYDHRNRLTQARSVVNGFALTTTTIDYAYDTFDRLVKRTKTVQVGAATPTTSSDFFVYEGDSINPSLQFSSTGAASPTLSHRYLWGEAVDQLFADEQVTSLTSAGNVGWALTDLLGTVREVADYASGSTTISKHKLYDGYGRPTGTSGTGSVDTIFGYTGKYYDTDSGLQNNYMRWYNPRIGQWMSEDPIGFAAGDANLRRYVSNDPVNKVDPSGLEEITDRTINFGKNPFDRHSKEWWDEERRRDADELRVLIGRLRRQEREERFARGERWLEAPSIEDLEYQKKMLIVKEILKQKIRSGLLIGVSEKDVELANRYQVGYLITRLDAEEFVDGMQRRHAIAAALAGLVARASVRPYTPRRPAQPLPNQSVPVARAPLVSPGPSGSASGGDPHSPGASAPSTNWRGEAVRIPEGHIMSPRDPAMSAPPIVESGPFTTAQRNAMLNGESGGTRLSPHHRHQIPTTHGGVIDELPGPGHPSGNIHTAGSPTRHPSPSIFNSMEGGKTLRQSEITSHWRAKGQRLIEVDPGVWIDPGF